MMLMDHGKTDYAHDWLSLGEAAHQLGVHPSTLRRWADSGYIEYLLTPGGHRRFARSDIEQFTKQNRQLPARKDVEQLWAERAMVHTRQGLMSQYHSRWLQAYDEEHREQERVLGRRLMGVVLQYLSNRDGEVAGLVEEARTLGHEYASNAMRHRLPIAAAVEAAMFFRDAMVEVAIELPHSTHLPTETQTNLLRKITAILNIVQLAIVQAYEEVELR